MIQLVRLGPASSTSPACCEVIAALAQLLWAPRRFLFCWWRRFLQRRRVVLFRELVYGEIGLSCAEGCFGCLVCVLERNLAVGERAFEAVGS